MNQLIIYCKDTQALPKQLIDAGYYTDEPDEDGQSTKVPHLPVEAEGMSVENGSERLTCVLMTPEQREKVKAIDCLQTLGSYEDIFKYPDLIGVYDKVYDRSEKTIKDDETGETTTYKPPDKFAEFALPKPDPDAIKAKLKAQRERMLESTTQLVMAYNEQKELQQTPDMSEAQYKQTLQYREQLRKML